MQTVLQPLPQPHRLLLIEDDRKKVEALLDSCWDAVKSGIEIPGFDKGQVPRVIAEKKLGEDQLYRPVIDALVKQGLASINESFCEIQSVEVSWQTAKSPLYLDVRGFLEPEVISCDYRDLINDYKRLMVTDEEINFHLKRAAHSEAEEIEIDPANAFDKTKLQIHIDFIMDDVELGKVIANQSDFKIDLTKNLYGFESALLEHKKGEIFQVACTLPADFYNKALAGRKVSYQIKIVKIFLLQIPAIDDALAQKMGFESLTTMRSEIARDLEAEKRKADQLLFCDHVMSLLVAKTKTTPLPESLLKKETQMMLIGAVNNANKLQQKNMTVQQFLEAKKLSQDDWFKMNYLKAQKKVISHLALRYIAHQEKLVPDEAQCIKALKELMPEIADHDEAKVDKNKLREYTLLKQAQDFLLSLYVLKEETSK
jgi:trigger factor